MLFRGEPQALALARNLADACWGQGRDLTDPAVLAAAVAAAGLPGEGLPGHLGAPEVKAALRTLTDEAIADGVFGVPTFRLDDEFFWGHDRLDHLADRLEGRLGPAGVETARMLGRPRGARRRREGGGSPPGGGDGT